MKKWAIYFLERIDLKAFRFTKTNRRRDSWDKWLCLRNSSSRKYGFSSFWGSRGPVRSERGYPQLTLTGFVGRGLVRTFLVTEDAQLKYHPFYQVCKVMNKQGSPFFTHERKIDQVSCVETAFNSKSVQEQILYSFSADNSHYLKHSKISLK